MLFFKTKKYEIENKFLIFKIKVEKKDKISVFG